MLRSGTTEPESTPADDAGGTPVGSSAAQIVSVLSRIASELSAEGCDQPESVVERAVFYGLLRELCAGFWLPPVLLAQLGSQGTLGTACDDILRDTARKIRQSHGPTVPDLGGVHQGLLANRLVRLKQRGYCFEPSRVWVQAHELQDQAPENRALVLRRKTGLSAPRVERLDSKLQRAAGEHEIGALLASESCAQRDAGAWVVQPSAEQRRSGSHFTPIPLARLVVRAALQPLVDEHGVQVLRKLQICDLAMGAGVFLLEARRFLAEQLGYSDGIEHSLFGIDLDPRAVLLTQLSLCLEAPGLKLETEGKSRFLAADGLGPGFGTQRFDVVLGNPPWIAYAGRAAQPLPPERAAYFDKRFAAFKGYRTLHGLFIERSAELLKPGGRLALVVPTSVNDLAGYRATRAAHDAWCKVDPALPDFGDGAFDGVFQPSMALLSTRRTSQVESSGCAWSLARSDLTPAGEVLLARLRALPVVPRELFGERGYQTRPHDRLQLHACLEPLPHGERALRTGTEVRECQTLPPRLAVDPRALRTPLRPEDQWKDVALLIRQTARFPIASPGDGLAFRNSILAGFESREHSRGLLVCWLNSQAIRWFHYHSQRDARQGMPQLKIAHLRALPAPPTTSSPIGIALHELGEALCQANAGIAPCVREELEDWVSQALLLDKQDRKLVSEWAVRTPLPKPRAHAP